MKDSRAIGTTLAGVLATALLFAAEPPNYAECRLDSIFPAGGQVGQTVTVEFRGGSGGLDGAKDILIDGPPGISVSEVKNVSGIVVQAKLSIAPDAVPGRRLLRVLNERSGLTCFGWFVVGRLPEVLETEGKAAMPVTWPIVVNGRVDPAADVDAFSFTAKAGQKLVVAVAAHALDVHGQYRNWGIADVSLQLLDERGRVVAESQDAIGLDPLIEYTVPGDGRYTAQVQLLGYGGFPEAVYRLTLGDVPVVTSVFPPGGQRGTSVDVTFDGPNVSDRAPVRVVLPAEDRYPLQWLFPEGASAGDHDVPFVRGDLLELIETEPNDAPDQATPVDWPKTVNARFLTAGDGDWYRIALKQGQAVSLEIAAHRFLRSPVDTLVQVHDASGKLLAENDDDPTPMDYMSLHDFKTTDSQLTFTAPADGEFLVRVSEQAGAGGPRCVYRLTIQEALPDFELLQFPDAVPVWGPGSTAALLVRIDRRHGFKDAVELRVDGLPDGWTGSTAVSPAPQYALYYGKRAFLTITAPADARPGTCVPFRVIGTATIHGEKVERVAQPITLFYSSDIGFFRVTPQARVAVARPQGPTFEPLAREVTVGQGATGSLPVRVTGTTEAMLTVVANITNDGVQTSLGSPQVVPVKDGVITVAIPTEPLPVGTHSLVISGRWGGDIRGGMPGPCTPVVQLHVQAKP